MERDLSALDGLLRELARAPEGDDEAFVGRVLARTQRRETPRPVALIAAAFLVAMGLPFALAPEAPTARLGFSGPACLVPNAKQMRVLLREPERGGLLLLGVAPMDAQVRVPADTPLLLQALGEDGLALWTASDEIKLRPREMKSAGPGPVVSLEKKHARAVNYAAEIKPILEQHCAGCHAEGDLVRNAVKPFEARLSALVTQTHAPLPEAARRELALWVDLGAFGRP